MKILLLIILAIIFIWRFSRIVSMVKTLDFWIGLSINSVMITAVDYFYRVASSTSKDNAFAILLALCMIFAGAKKHILPKKMQKAISFPVSSGWIIPCAVIMGIVILIYSGSNHYRLDFNAFFDSLLFGILLMIISNSARVPWLVFLNICFLGFLAINISNQMDSFNDGDTNVDSAYSVDSDNYISADYSSYTPVIDATPDITGTDFMVPTSNVIPDFTPMHHWGTFDLTDTSFLDSIPQFSNDPYQVLSVGANVGDNFWVCNATGMPELFINNGSIFNAEHVLTGHINYDPTLHLTTYTDSTNMPFMYVDQSNNIYTGDHCFTGHFKDSGNIRTFFDAHGHITHRLDKLTNTFFGGKDSNIIGKILRG